jgi:hypothetical protein
MPKKAPIALMMARQTDIVTAVVKLVLLMALFTTFAP